MAYFVWDTDILQLMTKKWSSEIFASKIEFFENFRLSCPLYYCFRCWNLLSRLM